MKLLLLLTIFTFYFTINAQDTLLIPPILSQPNIDLTLQYGTHSFYNSTLTETMGANGNILGPTLILYKDSSYNITVNNDINDTTTIHWHGLHISPSNDGGPHTTIAPGTTWNPQFKILDKAGTFWYHPHLHEKTDEHVSKGIAGMLLVRDQSEIDLGLPLNYGVDEFPLVIQTKGFNSFGEIEFHTEMDTAVMVNATVNAIVNMPAQIVRLRVLNGSSQRVFEFGFSDNKIFSLIGTDGGLLTAPVELSRYRLAPGQRADILVDLSSSLGQNIQILSYGSELPNAIYGASQPGRSPNMTIPGYDNNPLNGANFVILNINVTTQTPNAILTIPSQLVSYDRLKEDDADNKRSLRFTADGGGMGNLQGPFVIDGKPFDICKINETVKLDDTEIWTITNQTGIAHPFHIHDIQFFILDINGSPPPPELQGLNDVILVPGGRGTVRFIAVFNDFADETTPYMYHCHMLTHEDGGMMGQFIVSEKGKNVNLNLSVTPNPSLTGDFSIDLSPITNTIESIQIYDLQGKVVDFTYSFDEKIIHINLNQSSGVYLLTVKTCFAVITQKLVVN